MDGTPHVETSPGASGSLPWSQEYQMSQDVNQEAGTYRVSNMGLETNPSNVKNIIIHPAT